MNKHLSQNVRDMLVVWRRNVCHRSDRNELYHDVGYIVCLLWFDFAVVLIMYNYVLRIQIVMF